MERLRDHFLAAAVFSGNEDICVGRADARDGIKDGLHGSRRGDEFRAPFGSEAAGFPPPAVRRAAERDAIQLASA